MPLSKSFCVLGGSILALGAGATITPFLPQSFFFDWNTPGQPVPIPTTPQCEVIQITWERGTAAATSPNPVSPYYLLVYTSTAIVPFVIPAGTGTASTFDWAVPFAPGTQYQICMFDKLGNTGGCQATYTVIPPLSTPNCTNVTYPPLLDVQATVDSGPMSQYGWIDQCTDISILPKNGTAPYILTVAPALHPPYNITSLNQTTLTWTVSLSWASPFFISLADSAGNMWSNGPLHSGGGGTTACLTGMNSSSSVLLVKPAVTIGSGVGGLVAGLLIGLAATYLLMKRSYKKKMFTDRFVDMASVHDSSHVTGYPQGLTSDFQHRTIPTTSTSGFTPSAAVHPASSQYQVEPFVMPDEDGRSTNKVTSSTMHEGHGTGHHVATPREAASSASQPPSHVYVLHHDSNIPPVTIFHKSGTEVVELPPRYLEGTSQGTSQSDMLNDGREGRTDTTSRSDGCSDASHLLAPQPRQPTEAKKPPRS